MKLSIALAILMLLPATGKSAENGQEDPSVEPASTQVRVKSAPTTATYSEKLRQIETYSIDLEGDWETKKVTNDEATALIVNPFSIRKRSNFYGSLYEYHRNDNFDARNFFDPVGQPLPEFKRNQFGVSLGLEAGKLKVFGSYDGLRIIRGSTRVSKVPTAAMKQGDFSDIPWLEGEIKENFKIVDPLTGEPFENNLIPQSRIHPVAKNLLSLFPNPNLVDPLRNYVNNKPFIDNSDTIYTRVDYELSSDTKLYGTYNINNGGQEMVSSLPIFGASSDDKEQDVSIDLTHSFSPNKVLSFEVRFQRNASLQLSAQSFQDGLLESVGIEGVSVLDSMDEGYPSMDILGYAGIGSSGGGFAGVPPESFHRNVYQIQSNFNYVRGNHNIVFGGDFDISQLNNMRTWGTRRGQFGFHGLFTGDSFADFLLGIPYTAARGIGSDRADLRQKQWRLSFRDNWKINHHLTLTMQLAYNYSPFYHSTHDNVSFFYPMVFEPPLDGEVIVTGSDRARELGVDLDPGRTAFTDKNDWQPSFAIAYSPFGNNRLVLRASYNIRHSNMNPIQALMFMGRNYPFFYVERALSGSSPDLDLGQPFESAAIPAQTFKVTDPNLRNSYSQNRQLSLRYEFPGGWSLELEYEGSKSTRSFRVIPSNVPLPSLESQLQERRPNPDYGMFEILRSDGSSTSNRLQTRVTRRMTDFFSLQGSFNWSRSISDSWGFMSGNPNNPRNLSAERGPSSSSGGFPGGGGRGRGGGAMKSFNMNFILDLPVGDGKLLSSSWAGKLGQVIEGWRISGIVSIQGGGLFSPEIFGDPNNDGVWGDRPNRIGNGNLSNSERSIDKWFETSDFEMPDYTGEEPQWFGNAGRSILYSPGSTQWDISFIKRTQVTESGHLLEFRVQLFNAFNHVNFNTPNRYINSSTFGVISGAEDAREIEIALKYSF